MSRRVKVKSIEWAKGALSCGVLAFAGAVFAQSPRHEFLLAADWRTTIDEANPHAFDGFESPAFDASSWRTVAVPHNWDDYGGEHRLVHGNRHGTAWYRRTFLLPGEERGRRVFLYFEGVGSYATVWVNGNLAGRHAGGRTTFTLDVTSLVHCGEANVVAVRADHPAGITDLPWVCGGCSDKAGFSEGSQPMGLFRPVHIVTTNDVRVAPFGVQVWNDADATAERAMVHVRTEIANAGSARKIVVETRVLRPAESGASLRRVVARGEVLVQSSANAGAAGSGRPLSRQSETGATLPTAELIEQTFDLAHVALWSPESPTLYTVETTLREGDRVLDRIETSFGIRTIHWPAPDAPQSAPFLVNGQPVFINGTCEYEHLLGDSHAFSDEQIRTRVAQFHAAGFNAFRDAHQPHNLRYQEYWDREGVLWWPQFASQIWYDTPEFRRNFKALLRDWVRERRNSPSLVLWGLANESKLPADFAAECVALIRELDPTSPSQRLVTTCNSGKGTDWNVPQNWSGTYGGNPDDYAADLRRQRLVGEYGAWRSLGLHSEGGFVAKGVRSEDRAAALLETKIRLAESVRAEVPGHFQWLLATHDNPGRTIGSEGQQGADGWAELDRIGPANNKGLFTLWGEPTDLFYLYRANFAPAARDPMVYIVSHTWPARWKEPGVKSGIIVYSNCDEVELFDDVAGRTLGVRQRGPIGTHFQWDNVTVRTNVLFALGRVGGKVVARDFIVLSGLPPSPNLGMLTDTGAVSTAAASGRNYLYRVNCGGGAYTDRHGQRWMADRDFAAGLSWGSLSWASEYRDVPARFGSQRELSDAVIGTSDQPLFQTYRYGRDKLRYRFAVPDGDYVIELYFTEPWYGVGGGDCTGWRLFDVAVNDHVVLHDLDLWREAGYAHAVKKEVAGHAKNGWLEISFPRVASYQAVISAIAIATTNPAIRAPADSAPPAAAASPVVTASPKSESARAVTGSSYPVKAARRDGAVLSWNIQLGLGGAHEFQVKYTNAAAQPVVVDLSVRSSDGTLMGTQSLSLAPTVHGVARLSAKASLAMNAGDYVVTVANTTEAVQLESLIVK
jgi:hypothetical protein